ncbi:hypothetical protein, partial [Saccharopolyspora shandongensis]|uniref:hypothetical protein n=1 Tax=Saccharopolyspora shandongensis TaxID=418495 RepID=UPI0033D160E7
NTNQNSPLLSSQRTHPHHHPAPSGPQLRGAFSFFAFAVDQSSRPFFRLSRGVTPTGLPYFGSLFRPVAAKHFFIKDLVGNRNLVARTTWSGVRISIS